MMASRQPITTRAEPEMSGVYVIACEGACKIGRAKTPASRLSTLRGSSPVQLSLEHYEPMVLTDARVTEKHAHALLAERRLNGEWFRVHPTMAVRVVKLAMAQVRRGDHIRPRASRPSRLGLSWAVSAVTKGDSMRRLRLDGTLDGKQWEAVVAYREAVAKGSPQQRETGRVTVSQWNWRLVERVEEMVARLYGYHGLWMLRRMIGSGEATSWFAVPGDQRRGIKRAARQILDLIAPELVDEGATT